ncbi:E3 ubiquitin-protein ligase MIB2-like [Haliotis rufescens]|uniref:E3 ubiquitin-protein ligase MIB2-like n=1 Tax=Haliotis rufescens TaxID=6454 RepID=UPI00201EED9F|nr:E3 ubiquitin-protein ligase MIB2-like [Haliotis rufescens]XP_046370586.2 E3 ubiquitin-protein ligase MIB2-like [Haliotis rufescens]XP_046370587.2 E3 ubiquitin-protein ligase MIB2-like [Haliotis rufescens]
MSVGLRVLRGPDWSSEDRDGGEGHVGTVASVGGEGTCEVLWDSGDRCMCRIGKFGKHDLRIFDNATIGVRHPDVCCDGCESQGISGMRWTCAKCKRCNLCSLCYVTDKHDLAHEFLRYDTPTSEGVKVKKRSASLKIRAMGMFPGSQVKRGADWNSANLDGGPGNVGDIITLINSVSTPSTRNMVKVKWPSGEVSTHRVGYQGKVDLQYIEQSPGTYYYKEHLPYLDAESARQTPVKQAEVLQVGDKVYIHVPAASLKSLQSDRSGWTSGMANCIGKVGILKGFASSGDATVEFGGMRFRFTPAALRKIPTLKQGEVVQLISEEDRVKALQDGHGEWTSDMKQVLGKCGKVVKVDDDGDVVVAFGKRTFLLNPASCVPAPGEKVFELAESLSPPRSSGAGITETHGDLLKLMAAMMMKDLHMAVADPDMMYQAIGKGDAGMVRSIVSKAPKLLNVNHKGVTPLILAAHEGQTEVVRALLELGADTSPTDGKGHTALHAALIGKKEKTAQLLLEKGANVQVCNHQKRSALHFAAFANLPRVMEDLIKRGSNVNAKDVAGDTALHDAIQKGNREAIELLMRAAKIDLSIPNNKGFNPLQFAAFTGNTSATQAILKRDTSVVNLQKGEDRFAALHIAAINDHVECARLLIDVGKAKVDIQGANGSTALHLACHEALYRTAELLLEKGADPNVKDVSGNTALHIAMGADKSTGRGTEHQLLAALLGLTSRTDDEARVKLACLLLQKKAIMDAKNNNGATPLDVAKSPTVKQAVQLFVRQNQGSIQRSATSTPRGGGARVQLRTTMFDMQLPCAKCMSKMADITLMPCGHKILCRQCCLTTEICPLCETHIERRLAKKERADFEEPCKVQ